MWHLYSSKDIKQLKMFKSLDQGSALRNGALVTGNYLICFNYHFWKIIDSTIII